MEREALKLALEALKECRDRFFPLDQHETARDLLWVPVHSAVTRCEAALAQPAQEPDALTIAYQSGYYDGKQAALAGREWNFCERCGKRTKDLTVIHTCTPPQEGT